MRSDTSFSRRELLLLAAASVGARAATASTKDQTEPFGYCLNTATIMGQKLAITEEVDIAARAGYKGIEPWVRELERHVKEGKSLKELGRRISDQGLSVENAIGFPEWIVDDPARRKKGLEDARHAMELVQQIGGKRLAAPPAGAGTQSQLNLLQAAERYMALAQIGEQMGVVPIVEFWGPSKFLSRLGEATLVAMESGYAKAAVLPDTYHMYKGNSGTTGLQLLRGQALGIVHMNDYPAEPARSAITDASRVYPGDGVAPLSSILRDLNTIGYRGMLSLEVFNRTYWAQDPFQVAKTGLEKMRQAVQRALA